MYAAACSTAMRGPPPVIDCWEIGIVEKNLRFFFTSNSPLGQKAARRIGCFAWDRDEIRRGVRIRGGGFVREQRPVPYFGSKPSEAGSGKRVRRSIPQLRFTMDGKRETFPIGAFPPRYVLCTRPRMGCGTQELIIEKRAFVYRYNSKRISFS